jgi:hypothetical protein
METNIGILFLVGVAFPLVTVVLRKENAKGRTEQSDDADAKKRNRGSRMAKVALTSVGMGVGYVVLRYVMSHFVFRSDRPLNFILIMGGVMALILFLSVVALAPTDRQRERLGY